MPKQYQAVLAAPKREFRSQFPLFPLDKFKYMRKYFS